MIVKVSSDAVRSRSSGARQTREGRATSALQEKSPFSQILEDILPPSETRNHSLFQLWEALPDAEKDFLEQQSDANLRKYKELVKQIARETAKRNFKTLKVKRKSRGGEDIELTVFAVIDEKLHQMTLLMRSPNNSAFQILKTMDEIRGMLVDARE